MFGLLFRNRKLFNDFFPSPSKNQIFLGFKFFILLVTRSLINNPFRYSVISERLFAKATCLFSFVVHQVCSYFTAHICFKKISFAYAFPLLRKCVHASTCFPKIPAIVKVFLCTALLQRSTFDSCLCCSVV